MTIRRNRTTTFIERAREMRQQQNDAESMIWSVLRDRRLRGFKFRRQYALGNYIADFYCAEAKLIVELDGKTHEGKEEYDETRDKWMESQGLHVLRVPNLELNGALEQFAEFVWLKCVERSEKSTRSPDPSP